MKPRSQGRAHRKPGATTSDILRPVEFEVPPRWQRLYKRLIGLRDLLAKEQESLVREAAEDVPNFSTHMADAGTDEFDRDLVLSALSSRQDSLYQVEAALDRIRQGSYGLCELTGKRIESERLEAVPWTRFSAQAERLLEKQGIPHLRQHLNPRDSVHHETAQRMEGED